MTAQKNKLTLIQTFEQKQIAKTFPSLKVGDTVKVHAKIKEGEKERVQVYEGVISRYSKGGNRSAITVRKLSFGVGVERTFPLYSPAVERVEKIMEGKVRRARLYYLRKRRGKAARIEGQWTQETGEELKTVGLAAAPVIAKDEGTERKSSAVPDAINARSLDKKA